jgi:hypothetical protein
MDAPPSRYCGPTGEGVLVYNQSLDEDKRAQVHMAVR